MGRNNLAKLIERAQKERREALEVGGRKEKVGAAPMVDGAAAVVEASSGEIEDGRKFCWNCKTPSQEDNLCLCSGCKKVRGTLKVLIVDICQKSTKKPTCPSCFVRTLKVLIVDICKKTDLSKLFFRRRATAARIVRTRTGSSIEASVRRGGSRGRQKRGKKAKKVKREKEKWEELKEQRDALVSWGSSKWRKKWTEGM